MNRLKIGAGSVTFILKIQIPLEGIPNWLSHRVCMVSLINGHKIINVAVLESLFRSLPFMGCISKSYKILLMK